MILGIDPGRDKTGWALVRSDGKLVLSGIFPTKDAEAFLQALSEGSPQTLAPFVVDRGAVSEEPFTVSACIVGGGTGSRALLDRVRPFFADLRSIPEEGTTLEARELYWELHPPRGLRKVLPKGLRVPPRGELDGLAAWAIVLRYVRSDKASGEVSEGASPSPSGLDG